MIVLRLWHGSSAPIDVFDVDASRDGGIHLGSRRQAQMRNSAVLHEVEIEIGWARRSKDRGGDWKNRIQAAKSSGVSAIVYLNRYEGLTADVIERLAAGGDLAKLDSLSDAEFRKLVPEAEDSYIIFDPRRIRILQVLDHRPQQEPDAFSGPEGP